DVEQIVTAAHMASCDAIHPGYGFLSEQATFAHRCAVEGIVFVGPTSKTLELLGDKARARQIAEGAGVPVLAGTGGRTSVEEPRGLFPRRDGAVMTKAIAGGGGRGMRPVPRLDELEAAYVRCRSEALLAFGRGDVYVEQLLPRARHVEVQIAGDRA